MSQLPVGSHFGSFMLMRHIGGGGMAQIYLAKIHGLAGFEKYLALKVINPEFANEERFIQMLIDEAKLTVGLSHVNIGQIFDLGQVDGTYYIAMEFVDGIDILELVNGLYVQSEKVPLEAVTYIGRQMCSGLHYAHTRKDKQGQPLNLIHRDISPQNILVSRAGEVKVVDFGIAKAAGMSNKTQAGVIKGKVHYMAPEQAMGKAIDHRIDIFSTGIVLWEMLTSQMVYSGDNVRELLEKVRRANIPPPSRFRPEVPEALDAIVMKALARSVEERFQTAHELMVELTKFLSASSPDYSGSHLASLVERVASNKQAPPQEEISEVLSKKDVIPDVHSVISQSISELEEPTDLKNVSRLEVLLDGDRSLFQLGEEVIVGRAGNLTVPDARVSRRHARFFRQQQRYYVEDLGSSNGTYVNDLRIGEPHELQPEDVVRVGSCQMRFIPGAKSTEQASTPPPAPAPATAAERHPRLLISQGAQRWEQPLTPEVGELRFTLELGPLQLCGRWGRISQREDGFWLEPLSERLLVLREGQPAAGPFRLKNGLLFEVGGCSFQFLE